MYNLTVATAHTFYVGSGQWLVHNQTDNSRNAAFRQAKRDLGLPSSEQPFKVDNSTVLRDPLTDKPILDANGDVVKTREYYFKTPDGRTVVIQEHSLGHNYGGVGDQDPHFNVRPAENLKTGKVPGTQEHYYFQVCK